jgi:hypothetical protein
MRRAANGDTRRKTHGQRFVFWLTMLLKSPLAYDAHGRPRETDRDAWLYINVVACGGSSFGTAAEGTNQSAGTSSKTLAAEVQRKRRRAVEEAANGIRRMRDGAVLFSVAATDWLKVRQTNWAPKTHVNAALDVQHLKSRFASYLLNDISAAEVSEYVKARRAKNGADKTMQ